MQAPSCVSLVSGFDGETYTHTSFKNTFTHLCSEHYLVTYQTRGILLYNGDGVLPGMEPYRGTTLTLLKSK